MAFFKQIIFPPLPKIVSPIKEIISFEKILDLEYWFEYTGASTRFMVNCPRCEKTYCYSTITSHTLIYDIELGIKEHPKFFMNEWEINCPDASIHCELGNFRDRYEI